MSIYQTWLDSRPDLNFAQFSALCRALFRSEPEAVRAWHTLGIYDGETQDAVLDVLAADAGYADFAHLCELLREAWPPRQTRC